MPDERQLQVYVDQDLCTGDGLCVQLAPDVFEFDVDGLAYVKDADGELRTEPGARVAVPARCVAEVVESAQGCPGDCIFVETTSGDTVAGPQGAGLPTAATVPGASASTVT